MGKVLIVTFADEEETTYNELIHFLKRKSDTEFVNAFPADSILKYEGITIDLKCRMVKMEGKNIELTNYEFEILSLLAENAGQVFSKEQIYNQIWNEPCYGAVDNVMSLIRRIRKKIEPNPARPIYILTVWGVGYKFNSEMK